MKILLDTHILLWAAIQPKKLNANIRTLLNDKNNELLFSAASIWEVSIKRALGRIDFNVDPSVLRRGLRDNDYMELPVTSEHACALELLPQIHRDPFDRILVAKAVVEGITLLTNDINVAKYPGPIRKI